MADRQGFPRGGGKGPKAVRTASGMLLQRLRAVRQKEPCCEIPFYAVPECGICEKARFDARAPAFCNSDYWGMSQLHGTLIRRGTCGNSDRCDYCVVGSEDPMAKAYEIVKDEAGFLVSRKIERE